MISEAELNRRKRTGKIAAILSVAWWIASIGGIIYVITLNA